MTDSPLPCKAPEEYRWGRLENLDLTDDIGAEVSAVLRELYSGTRQWFNRDPDVISGIAQ